MEQFSRFISDYFQNLGERFFALIAFFKVWGEVVVDSLLLLGFLNFFWGAPLKNKIDLGCWVMMGWLLFFTTMILAGVIFGVVAEGCKERDDLKKRLELCIKVGNPIFIIKGVFFGLQKLT